MMIFKHLTAWWSLQLPITVYSSLIVFNDIFQCLNVLQSLMSLCSILWEIYVLFFCLLNKELLAVMYLWQPLHLTTNIIYSCDHKVCIWERIFVQIQEWLWNARFITVCANLIQSWNLLCWVLLITCMDVWFILIQYIHQMSTVPE